MGYSTHCVLVAVCTSHVHLSHHYEETGLKPNVLHGTSIFSAKLLLVLVQIVLQINNIKETLLQCFDSCLWRQTLVNPIVNRPH